MVSGYVGAAPLSIGRRLGTAFFGRFRLAFGKSPVYARPTNEKSSKIP
jgi:hypothetical protein